MNLDTNKVFPNQEIDNDQTECVALTVADIAGNTDKQLYDPDMVYAMTLLLEGQQPNTNGLDPEQGMMAAICFGLLPISLETFTAKTMGELYVANAANYTPIQKAAMAQHVKNGKKDLFTYADVVAEIQAGNPVSLPMHWYQNFTTAEESLTQPIGQFTNHNVAVYDADPVKGIMIKPWLGPDYGIGGYTWMSETIFTQVFAGTAYAFDPTALRWLSLLGEINYLKYLISTLYA